MQFRKVADPDKPLVPNPTGGYRADGSKATAAESVNPGVPTYSKQVKEVILEQGRDVERMAVSAFQKGIVDLLIEEGTLETPHPRDPQVGDEFRFNTVPPAVYRVTAARGRYCETCGEKLSDDDFSANAGEAARAHVAAEHPDAEPPGYRCDNFVVMERVA